MFFTFLLAMFVTMVLIPPLMWIAGRFNVFDFPDERKVHTRAIPRIGGIAMVAGVFLPLILWLVPQQQVVGLLIGMGVILLFGVWDDCKNLDYRVKFLGQLLAALVVVVYGGVRIEIIPFSGLDALPIYWSIPLTVFILMGVTNAINLADGLDGLAGGTTLLSLGAIALLAYLEHEGVVVFIVLALIGSILGFLRFNTHPARIFMGDGGSQFLGFSVGVSVLMLTHHEGSHLSPALPILLLGLPILDTAMVIGQRLYEGRSPFSPDKNHIHHKLLALGFDHYEAVFFIYIVQAALVISAYFLRYAPDAVILAVYAAVCVLVLMVFRLTAISGWRVRQQIAVPLSPLSPDEEQTHRVGFQQYYPSLSGAASWIALVAIPAYLILSVVSAKTVSADIGLLAAVLVGVLLLLFLKQRGHPFNWIERAGIYILSTLVIHLNKTVSGYLMENILFWNLFFFVLVLVVIAGFRFSPDGRFKMTPLDFLVIFIAFTVPNLPGLYLPAVSIGAGIAQLIVLFYGIELILTQCTRHVDSIRYTLYAALTILCLRSF